MKSNSSKAYLGIMSRIIYNISDITIKVRWKSKGFDIVKIYGIAYIIQKEKIYEYTYT